MEIKTINDYVDVLQQKYPNISKEDIKRILKYGWLLVYKVNSLGGDLFIRDPWVYFGKLHKDTFAHYRYYLHKLCTRLKEVRRRKKIPWDGYYYFALSDAMFEQYQSLKKRRGRPKKWFLFGPLFLYQSLDECKLAQYGCKYIFRIPYSDFIKPKFFVRNLLTDKAEHIITREPLKFQDVLVLNNNYDIL